MCRVIEYEVAIYEDYESYCTEYEVHAYDDAKS